MKVRATRKAQQLILRILKSQGAGKACYNKAKELAEQLKGVLPVGEEIKLEDGRRFAVVDEFATKDTAFKAVYLDRYKLTELKG